MPSVHREEIVDFLRKEILLRTGIPAAELSDDTMLSALGLSSLDVVLISGAIEDHFNMEVDPTMMFEYHTVNAVADRLVALLPSA